MSVSKVWKVSTELHNVHCIKHPKSDWFRVPYVDEKGNPKPLHNGLSEIVCANCLIPSYVNTERSEIPKSDK